MAVTYELTNVVSDLSGGLDFNTKLLQKYAGGPTSLNVAVVKGATDTSRAFTDVGEPGSAGTNTGTFTLVVDVTTGSTNIFLAVAISRSGETATAFSAEQQATAGQKTFTFTSPALNPWGPNDRLWVYYQFRNSNTMSNASVSIAVNETSTVTAPWNNVVPSAPQNLSGSPTNSTTVDLSWTAPTTGTKPFTYQVFQDGAFKTSVTTTTAQITGLTEGTPYMYEVRALNVDNTAGPLSSPATVTPAPYSRKNSLDTGQAAGTAITTSNSGGGVGNDPFNEVISVSMGQSTYEAPPVARASSSLVGKFWSFQNGGQAGVRWAAPDAQCVTRQYFLFEQGPQVTSLDIFEIEGTEATLATLTKAVYVDLELNVKVRGAVSSFATIALNKWYRLETRTGTNGGDFEVFLYDGESTTPLATYTEAIVGFADLDHVRFVARTTPGDTDPGATCYFDDVAVKDSMVLLGPTGTSTPTQQGTAALTSSSTLTIGAVVQEHAATAMLASSQLSTGAATATRLGTSTMTSTSTLTAAGTVILPAVTHQGAAALTSTSTLTAAGVRAQRAAAAMTSTSTLTSAATRGARLAAQLTASSTLTAGARNESFRTASLTSSSTLSSAATMGVRATAALSSTSQLTASSAAVVQLAATMTSSSVLTVAALPTRMAFASFVSSSTLSSAALRIAAGAASMSSTSVLTASVAAVRHGLASLLSTSTLSSAAQAVGPGGATMTSSSTLTASVTSTVAGAASLSSTSVLTASTSGASPAGAALTSSSTLSSGALRLVHLTAALSSSSSLSSAAQRTAMSVAQLSSTSQLTAGSVHVFLSSASFSSSSQLSVATMGEVQAAANLIAASTLNAPADVVRHAFAELVAVSTLQVAAQRQTAGTAVLSSTSVMQLAVQGLLRAQVAMQAASTMMATLTVTTGLTVGVWNGSAWIKHEMYWYGGTWSTRTQDAMWWDGTSWQSLTPYV